MFDTLLVCSCYEEQIQPRKPGAPDHCKVFGISSCTSRRLRSSCVANTKRRQELFKWPGNCDKEGAARGVAS